MSIERLSFSPEDNYSAVELAVHLTRYSTAQKICEGLNVLDVACGEGYGSYAMAAFWKAKSVKGIDVSATAIGKAQNTFSHPNVEYLLGVAENIDELFEPNNFDMVISLETIEHVNDPEKFLRAIKKVLKPNGVIILSCPNDHWYYGPGESQNPFHLRTYYFDEFRMFSEKHFGAANFYLLGRPITGFGNFLWTQETASTVKTTIKNELLNFTLTKTNRVSPDRPLPTDDSSFFVGVWGDLPIAKEEFINCTFYPTSMDKFSLSLEDKNNALLAQINALTANVENSQKWNEDLQNFVKNLQKRIFELEKWTVELQALIKNHEKTVTDLKKEQQRLLKNHNIRILELNELIITFQKQISDYEEQNNQLRLNIVESNEKIRISEVSSAEQQSELEVVRRTIASMEESRFWKIRNQWFKFKDNLLLNKKRK